MKWLRNLGYPLSVLYGWVVYFRNKCYDWGWLSSREYDVPILCVGNLSVGGSGKTPMVEWLLSRLLPHRTVAVLSRGYKRQSRGFRLVTPTSTAEESGDEPLQIARKFPRAIVAVDADRRRGIETLQQLHNPDLILLDDGFQHRRVRPLRSILLTAYDELYPLEPYLPAGNLRDHRSQARRADLVVVTKCPPSIPGADRSRVRELLQLQPGQQLVFSSLCYQEVVDLQGSPVPMERLTAQPLTVVTGIARPGPMLEYLKGEGIRFEHLKFGDHHRFNASELELLRGRGTVLTTEKDAMRLEGQLESVWVLPVGHCFSAADLKVMDGFLSQF